jgi:hypothetical protein
MSDKTLVMLLIHIAKFRPTIPCTSISPVEKLTMRGLRLNCRSMHRMHDYEVSVPASLAIGQQKEG